MNTSRSPLADLHWGLIAVTAVIAAMGCYNLHSAAAGHDPRLYLTQMFWFGCGAALCAVVLTVDYRITEAVAYVVYGVACVLLLTVLLTGKQAMGARRWLIVGPLTFQPSEIAKVATILGMARYFSHRPSAGGYTIGALVRPLNITRPLGCFALLCLFWQRPFLVDPVGELARKISTKLDGNAPALEELWWFRTLLLGCIVCCSVGALVYTVRAERAAQLLHPWPPARRRRQLTAIVLLGLALLVGLFGSWNSAVMQDPFGSAIAALNAAARPGGAYAELHTAPLLRLVLAVAVGLYLVAALVHLRQGPPLGVDRIVAPLDLVAAPALMTLVQPDLGTAGIIILIGMTIVLIVGVRLRSLITLGMLGALTSAVAWFGVLKDYQKRRILTFIDPEQDLRGAGWNAVQSLIAVGSGRWVGKGHMGGTQTQLSFLPEQHTDFAFSVWAEEMGFAGCVVLLLLYLALLSLAFHIAAEARETYGMLLATGVAALIFWQAVINIGMVIGVLPVVGLTLPLFSYGGSSVLTVLLGIGLLLNIHWRRRSH